MHNVYIEHCSYLYLCVFAYSIRRRFNADENERPYDIGAGFVVDDVENYKTRIFKELNNSTIFYITYPRENIRHQGY